MSETRPPYVTTPTIPGVVVRWKEELARKAERLHAMRDYAVLTVLFAPDGTVTFFDGTKAGRIANAPKS